MLISPGDFSYSGDPSTSQKDQVRFLIGDTEVDDMILTDAEIEWCITNRGSTNLYLAASDAADLAGHKYSRIINRQTGTLSLSMSTSSNPFQQRSKALRQLASERRVGPVLASDSLASNIASHGGRRPPLFWVGMHDNQPSDHDHEPDQYGGGYPYTNNGVT